MRRLAPGNSHLATPASFDDEAPDRSRVARQRWCYDDVERLSGQCQTSPSARSAAAPRRRRAANLMRLSCARRRSIRHWPSASPTTSSAASIAARASSANAEDRRGTRTAQPPLKKATITVLAGANQNKVITVLFNPDGIHLRSLELVQVDTGAGPRRAAAAVRERRIGPAEHGSLSRRLHRSTRPDVIAAEGDRPARHAPARSHGSARDRQQAARAAARALQLGPDGVHGRHREDRPQGHHVPSRRHAGARDAVGVASRNTARCGSWSKTRAANPPTRPSVVSSSVARASG